MSRRPAIAALLLAVACNQGFDHESSQQAIVNGAPSFGDDAIVALLSDGVQYCSGTLVTPEIVVTAAHCVPPHAGAAESIEVFFGNDTSAATGETIGIRDAIGYPGWDRTQVKNDIGVIALERPAPARPMAMLTQPLEMVDPVGVRARVVGYGVTASGGGNGIKRSGEMEIVAIDDSTIHLAPGPSSTCSGDSGGALLLDVGGVEVLAGVHSRSDCDDTALNERVDIHAREFILNFAEAQGAEAVCGADGLCAEGCSTPDVDCLCAEDNMCTDACVVPETDPDCPESLGGCSSASGQSSALAVVVVLLALAIRRRREAVAARAA